MSLSEADLDLLADYIEGLLGSAEAGRVADLIASDAEWATTYQLLTGASSQVDHALNAYAAGTPALPSDVADRIDDAIRDERRSVARPISLEAARKRRDSRRSWLGLSAAAAAIVAVIFGLTVAGLNQGGSSKSSTTGASRPNAATDTGPLAAVRITSSTRNYTQSDLGLLSASRSSQPFTGSGSSGSQQNPEPHAPGALTESGPPIAPQLQRLADPGGLSACLSAITAAHGGVAKAAEFAQYEGRPALIVTLVNPNLRVAAGPDCGLPNSGVDELAVAPAR